MEIDFAKLWERDKKDKKNQQKFWTAEAGIQFSVIENSSPKETKVIDYLVQIALKTDGSVLDIGWPGNMLWPLQKR